MKVKYCICGINDKVGPHKEHIEIICGQCDCKVSREIGQVLREGEKPASPEPAPVTMEEKQEFAYTSTVGHVIHDRQKAALAKGEETTFIGDIDNPDLRRFFDAGWEWRVIAEDSERARAQARIVAQHEELLGKQRELQDARDELWQLAQEVPDAQ